MPHPPVYVRVTFVYTKAGSKPPITINSLDDMSELLGDNRSNKYEKLKSRPFDIVEQPVASAILSAHHYKFDEKLLQKGTVYGIKCRQKKDGSKAGKKMTARHLIDIWSALDFQKHLEDVSEVDFQRRGRNNRLKNVAM